MNADPQLVVIVGPIASGKSTIARALGAELRAKGRRVAVLDLDDMIDSIGGFVDLEPEQFHRAQLVLGQLVGSWLYHRFDVIVHGPFFSPEENWALTHALGAHTHPRRVLLRIDLAVAIDRVGSDPDRMLARYSEVLEATYARFDELRSALPPSEWTFDTSRESVGHIVQSLTESLLAR